MGSDRMESIFPGEAGGDIRKYLKIGGTVFLVIAVLSYGETASWPIKTGFETVEVGATSVQLSTLTSIFLIGLIALGVLMAFMPARRNNGLLVSLLLGSVPIFGYYVGGSLYYGIFSEIGYLPIPPFLVLVGAIVGAIGFTLGRKW